MAPNYANMIFVASNPERNEVVIRLQHEYPDPEIVPEENKQIPVLSQCVAHVVISTECAKRLYEILGDVLGKNMEK